MSDVRTQVMEYLSNRSAAVKRLHNSFGTQARNYNIAYFTFFITSLTVLSGVLCYNIHHLLKDKKEFLSILPISIPLYLLFWMCFDRAKHYSYLAVFYRHKERILDLSDGIKSEDFGEKKPKEYKEILTQIYTEVLILEVKKPDKTKEVLKLLQEINKAFPKRD